MCPLPNTRAGSAGGSAALRPGGAPGLDGAGRWGSTGKEGGERQHQMPSTLSECGRLPPALFKRRGEGGEDSPVAAPQPCPASAGGPAPVGIHFSLSMVNQQPPSRSHADTGRKASQVRTAALGKPDLPDLDDVADNPHLLSSCGQLRWAMRDGVAHGTGSGGCGPVNSAWRGPDPPRNRRVFCWNTFPGKGNISEHFHHRPASVYRKARNLSGDGSTFSACRLPGTGTLGRHTVGARGMWQRQPDPGAPRILWALFSDPGILFCRLSPADLLILLRCKQYAPDRIFGERRTWC